MATSDTPGRQTMSGGRRPSHGLHVAVRGQVNDPGSKMSGPSKKSQDRRDRNTHAASIDPVCWARRSC